MKPSKWLILLVLTVGILAISASAILVRLANLAAGMNGLGFSLVIATSRIAIPTLLLVPAWSKIQWHSLQSGSIFYASLAGVCLPVYFVSWITSLSYTSIAASTTLVTTTPIWVAFLSWLWLKEKPTHQTVIGIVVAMIGGLMVALADIGEVVVGSHPLLGNLLAIIGAWATSLYMLLGRKAQSMGFGIGGYLVVVYSVATVVLLPISLVSGVGYTGYSGSVYFYLLLTALLPQLVGHTTLNWSVRWISPTLVSLTMLFEPIGASFLGYLLFGEVPSIIVLLALIVLLIGVAITATASQKK